MTDTKKDKPLPAGLSYDRAVAATSEKVRRLLKSAPLIIRHMTSHLAKASGKMIRARALLACALRQDGLINPDAVKTAAAAELMHLSTLIHDDIIDEADTRRGIDALHRKFGDRFAVLCGDWLFCTALDMISELGELENRSETVDRTFPRYLSEVCLGEMWQDQNYRNFALTERQYFRVIWGKTAALFEACFYAGFMFSDEPDSSQEIYKKIGSNIGIIFQLSDDCADYEATEQQTKKPVLSDYTRGVVTLPLIFALKKDPALLTKITEGIEPPAMKDAVTAAGGLSYVHAKISRLHKKTNSLLHSLAIGAEKRELLERLLDKASGMPFAK
jgi:geranylgeranyl pyrophosphate synthase